MKTIRYKFKTHLCRIQFFFTQYSTSFFEHISNPTDDRIVYDCVFRGGFAFQTDPMVPVSLDGKSSNWSFNASKTGHTTLITSQLLSVFNTRITGGPADSDGGDGSVTVIFCLLLAGFCAFFERKEESSGVVSPTNWPTRVKLENKLNGDACDLSKQSNPE